jgi:hypothetical protein
MNLASSRVLFDQKVSQSAGQRIEGLNGGGSLIIIYIMSLSNLNLSKNLLYLNYSPTYVWFSM